MARRSATRKNHNTSIAINSIIAPCFFIYEKCLQRISLKLFEIPTSFLVVNTWLSGEVQNARTITLPMFLQNFCPLFLYVWKFCLEHISENIWDPLFLGNRQFSVWKKRGRKNDDSDSVTLHLLFYLNYCPYLIQRQFVLSIKMWSLWLLEIQTSFLCCIYLKQEKSIVQKNITLMLQSCYPCVSTLSTKCYT